ncbi:hypothetical protein, conserved [Eimeria maxima]|uniref:Cytidyltransferase-like domain-containing protein n=1 Tax=Eimeria maxima TaxID=5804 RepID=U6M1A3_EIMMA|nr:hypothetical protein, conserved [Eimeria maxima]CDJ56868.1 hypothetical protein, conserved [Eimeria maxima]
MASAKSCCFQEDAACVIIDEGVVRRLAPTEADACTEASIRESCELDDLVLFLGRALLLTRRNLYVLLCVPTECYPTSSPSLLNEPPYVGSGRRIEDAATVVSCGSQAWHLTVCLNTRVGILARRLELTSVPIIIPWVCENSHGHEPAGESTPACKHWAQRARAAVLHHYRLTVGVNAFWQCVDEAELANAVPLVLDTVSSFCSREACALWPRHCHLRPLHSSIEACPSKHEFLLGVEGQGISKIQQSSPAQPKYLCRETTCGASKEFMPAARQGDTAKADEEVSAEAPFGYALVAGTFDRLHAGHQLLLAAAVLSARRQIGLAVASGPLVKKKKVSENDVAAAGIEPFACRLQASAAFVQLLAASKGKAVHLTGFREALEEEERSMLDDLQLQSSLAGRPERFSCGSTSATGAFASTAPEEVDGSMQLQIFRITDPVGPADRLAFDCLVVSAETVKGANMVNKSRVEAGNEPVFVLSVELVPTDGWVPRHSIEALARHLPFHLFTEADQFEGRSDFSRPTVYETLPESLMQSRANAATKEEEPAGVARKYRNSKAESLDTSWNKLSSTTLRQQQLRRLCYWSIAELRNRFEEAWFWLARSKGEGEIAERLSSATMWNILCAEHAVPWRRLHTFDRLARALKRLESWNISVKREPIVLSLFLGSMLACPCKYVTLTTRACEASDPRGLGRADSATLCTCLSWSPEAEDAAWQRCAIELLTKLQCTWGGRPSANVENCQQATGKVSASPATASFDTLLEGHFSLLMDLLWEQRTATLARLAPTVRPVSASRRRHAAVRDDGVATFRRLARRLEQLEFTDISMDETTRLQRLRQEYFFVTDDCFNSYRVEQLAQLLESESSLDCLSHDELSHAREKVECELNILASQSLRDEQTPLSP